MNNMIPAVEKTVLLMELLAKRPEGATQSELRKELGISMSTAYRILQTLLEHKWVKKNTRGIYTPDNGLLPLLCCFRSSMQILEHAQEVIDNIALRYEMACKLSIRRNSEQVTLLRAEPEGPIALTGQVGSSFPVIEGSVGAALLCDESDAAIQTLIADCSVDLAEKRDPELVFQAVHEVRTQGYVLNLRSNRWNIAAISMPVRNAAGTVIAALSLIGRNSDFDGEKREELRAILEEAVAACSTGA